MDKQSERPIEIGVCCSRGAGAYSNGSKGMFDRARLTTTGANGESQTTLTAL